MDTFTYAAGDEHPALQLPWQEESAANTFTNLDLSSGYTFVVSLIADDGTSNATSPVVTGADGSVSVAWAVDDLALTAGTYTLKLVATETATSKDRTHSPNDPVRIHIV